MDRDDLELFERSLRNATESHTGAALDAALVDLGWHEALAFEPRAAVETLFEQQGSANVTSSALDDVLRNGLGVDAVAAVVKKELFTFFNCRFTVDVPGPDDLEAQGDLTDHEYTFTRGATEVAHVSKQWFSLADTYGVDIADGEDDILILASTVVIVTHSPRVADAADRVIELRDGAVA